MFTPQLWLCGMLFLAYTGSGATACSIPTNGTFGRMYSRLLAKGMHTYVHIHTCSTCMYIFDNSCISKRYLSYRDSTSVLLYS